MWPDQQRSNVQPALLVLLQFEIVDLPEQSPVIVDDLPVEQVALEVEHACAHCPAFV
jgi:hypothetical protein